MPEPVWPRPAEQLARYLARYQRAPGQPGRTSRIRAGDAGRPVAGGGDSAHRMARGNGRRSGAQPDQGGAEASVGRTRLGHHQVRPVAGAVLQLLAPRVQDDRRTRLGGVGHQRAVDIRRQPIRQVAAQHDARGARQQAPEVHREQAKQSPIPPVRHTMQAQRGPRRGSRLRRGPGSGRACGPPMNRPDLLAIAAETGGQMVIDDAAGLHRRVRRHRAGEDEAMPP